MTKLTKEELLARTAAEDALPIEQLTPEQKARRQTRDRKRTQRANEKEQKAVEAELADLSKFQNCHEWWAASRKKLTVEEAEKLEAKNGEILDMVACMDDYTTHARLLPDGSFDLTETGTVEADLIDTVNEVKEMVAKSGTVVMEMTLVPRFWCDGPLTDAIAKRSRADRVFMLTGYLETIPDHVYHRFHQKFAKYFQTAQPVAFQVQYTRFVCPDCRKTIFFRSNAGSVTNSLPAFTTAASTETSRYRCPSCDPKSPRNLDLMISPSQVKSPTTQTQQALDVEYKAAEANIYDSFGHFMDTVKP